MSYDTVNGLVVPGEDELLDSLVAALKAKPRWGPAIHTGPESVLGQLLRVMATALHDALTDLADVEASLWLSGASGTALDRLVALAGITREAATHSTVTLTCSGSQGTVIPAGSRVAGEDGQYWQTTQNATIGAGGTVDVPAQSVETGPVEGPAGTITTIVDTVAGWDSVTNNDDAVLGRYEETDDALRRRYLRQLALGGGSTVTAIQNRLEAVSWVSAATVVENTDLEANSEGQPGRSIQPVVYPSTTDAAQIQELAQALWGTRGIPAGVRTWGTQSYTITDPHGNPYTVRWSWATTVACQVQVTLVDYTSALPGDYQTRIKQAVTDYFGTLSIGTDVLADAIAARIWNSVDGLRDIDVQVARSGGSWAQVVDMGSTEIATISTSDITIS